MKPKKPYRDYADFLAEHFTRKVQKISVNAGFTCPNRDGSRGTGGCTYCNNRTFNPAYCDPIKSVSEQIGEGKRFFGRKYPNLGYLAYFQAFTNTYGRSDDELIALYTEAIREPDVEGLIIATRPDCVSDALLSRLAQLPVPVIIEYGAESSHDSTLRRINRCHTWGDTVDAVRRTVDQGLLCGAHFILGLPGESINDMLTTIDRINELPLHSVKFHQLQVIKGTRLASQLELGEVEIIRWSAEEYAELCAMIVRRLRPDIAIERFVSQSPGDMLIFPRWGLKNYQFTHILHHLIAE